MATLGEDQSMLGPGPAQELVTACVKAAAAEGRPLAIAVVDASGGVVHVRRPAPVPSLFGELTIAKAVTAATFGMPKAALQEWQRRRPILHAQLSTLNRYPIVPMAGSVTLRRGDHIVGGLAVTSADGLEDQGICDAALGALEYEDDESSRAGGGDSAMGLGTALDWGGRGPLSVSIAAADRIADEVLLMSDEMGREVSVVVSDLEGALVSARRSHPAATTVDLAAAKAYTSAITGRPTATLEVWQEDRPTLALQLSALAPYPIIADFGGFPVRRGNRILGGLGISGARGVEDQQLGERVLQLLGFEA